MEVEHCGRIATKKRLQWVEYQLEDLAAAISMLLVPMETDIVLQADLKRPPSSNSNNNNFNNNSNNNSNQNNGTNDKGGNCGDANDNNSSHDKAIANQVLSTIMSQLKDTINRVAQLT